MVWSGRGREFMLLDWRTSAGNLTDEEKYLFLQYKVQEMRLAEVFVFFRENGVEPILIKGWAAARYYPKPFLRAIGDIDLAVCPEDYEKALELKRGFGDAALDIHRGLRHLDTLDWEDLFRNSQEVACGDGFVRVLRPEDHLRVLAVHWLTDGGAYRNKLWDIFYLLESCGSDFDWERCLGQISARRRRWVICVVGVVRKYLGLQVEGLPFAAETEDLPVWFVQALEKEWASDVRLLPLHQVLGDKRELWRQIKKRVPPNPIQAVVEMEGDFANRVRLHYQLGSILKRSVPSWKRIWAVIRSG